MQQCGISGCPSKLADNSAICHADSKEIIITGRARSGLPDAECLAANRDELSMLEGIPVRNPHPLVFSVSEPIKHHVN